VKFSVVIPAYNCARTISSTLESALRQTRAPDEIIVLDDGSTDKTAALVQRYAPSVQLVYGKHAGAAAARNELCQLAKNELVAFLDSDDMWHPTYLEVQSKLFHDFPDAAAIFMGHVDFQGYGEWSWKVSETGISEPEEIGPLEFIERYTAAPGPFSSMSYCCIPKRVLREFGPEPFQANGAEDTYLFHLFPLTGSVIYNRAPLVAYRITESSLSSDRLMCIGARIEAFERLRPRYKSNGSARLIAAFEKAFASHRRLYSKLLIKADDVNNARAQLRKSLQESYDPTSVAKSLGMLAFTYFPRQLRPKSASASLQR
jgi:glycosyltransferase involved in cell wall biosynthesis